MKKLNLGNSDFRSTIENNNYFIDKSLLIKDIIDSQSQVILLPQPRRFGKTLNLSMIKCFFDINNYGIVIEIKQIALNKDETIENLNLRINAKLQETKKQIERNKYYKELVDNKIDKNICLPVVFAGKEPFITVK